MRINILLLPLIGGYLFIKNTHYFGLRAIRYNNQELLLSSAAAGLCALIPSYLITIILSSYTPILNGWHNILNFAYSGTALGALVLLLLAIPIERLFNDEEYQIKEIIKEDNDSIERILLKALQEEKLVCITLKSNKVYVGFISKTFFTPYRNLQSIRIIPVISGYRKEEDMSIVFTTAYEYIIDFVDSNKTISLDVDDFQTGLPLSEIISINIFDFRVYSLFQSTDTSQGEFNFKKK